MATAGDDYSIRIRLVLDDVERKLADAVRKVTPIVRETFLGVIDIFAPELSVLLDSVRAQAKQVLETVRMWRRREAEEQKTEVEEAKREGETFVERMQRRLGVAGEVAGGAMVAGGAAVGAGAITIVAIQSAIQIIKQILDYLKRISPLLGAMFRLIESSIMLLLKPIADFIAYLLKPIIVLFYRYIVVPFYRTVMPYIMKIGKAWDEFITGFVKSVGREILEALQVIADAILELKKAFDSLVRDFDNFLASFGFGRAAVKTPEETGFETVVETPESALGKLNKAISETPQKFGQILQDIFKPVIDFFSWVGRGFRPSFSFQWGGVVPFTGFYRLHAGERVIPSWVPQVVYVYPRIEIGSVNVGDARDMLRLEERINRAIADALRRRY
jgi:hypothetical protein